MLVIVETLFKRALSQSGVHLLISIRRHCCFVYNAPCEALTVERAGVLGTAVAGSVAFTRLRFLWARVEDLGVVLGDGKGM